MVEAIEARGVNFAYGRGASQQLVLNDVSFSVKQGGFKVLMGMNGAGKSTLFSLLSCLHACDSGNIFIFGEDVNKNPLSALRQMGVVFQQQTLEAGMSVIQNLQYYGCFTGTNEN